MKIKCSQNLICIEPPYEKRESDVFGYECIIGGRHMKYALIGCGRISRNHIIAAKKNNLEIVAICDIKQEALDWVVDAFGLDEKATRYIDYHEMLEMEKPELVAIATESGLHAKIALACIEKRCNVLIEKPMALSIKDADAIIEAAERKKVKVGVVHQNRFNSAILKLREAVEREELGKILYGVANIRWNRDRNYYESGKWRGTWENDGGVLMNQGIHDIDLLCWILGGDIVEVMGRVDNRVHDYIEVEDFGAAIIKSSNGTYGIIEGTTGMYLRNYEESLTVFGEKGIVKIGGQAVNSIDDWITEKTNLSASRIIKKENTETPPNVYGFGHTLLYKNVIDAIISNKEPLVNGVEGKKALEVILAIYKSNQDKIMVKLPLTDIGTNDFKGMIRH